MTPWYSGNQLQPSSAVYLHSLQWERDPKSEPKPDNRNVLVLIEKYLEKEKIPDDWKIGLLKKKSKEWRHIMMNKLECY